MIDRSKVQLVIFDLDGTLIDSRMDIHKALNHALDFVGAPPLSMDVMLEHFARGSKNLMSDLLGPDEKTQQTALMEYRQHYQENMYNQTQLFHQVPELLNMLAKQNIALAVVSNKREEPCHELLDFFNIAHHFEVVLGGDSLATKKPSPEPLFFAADHFKVKPERALMVGDSPVDILAGQQAGCQTVGILHGFTPREQMMALDATLIVDQIHELLNHLAPSTA
jgi:phosphoglycolate phosphatase